MTALRLEKIDLLRGCSVIGMIFFHANYMLESIFYRDIIPLPDVFWNILGPMVAISFIFLSGFSSFLASHGRPLKYNLRKGGYRVLELGMIASLISLVTFYFIPNQRISWGIIHFFALSAAIFPLFSLAGKYTIFFGIGCIAIGYFFGNIPVTTDLLIPWGWIPVGYFSADYYPIFPWFGYALMGHGIAYWLSHLHLLGYLKGGTTRVLRPIGYIGRHALVFYVIHPPLLYIIFHLFL